MKKLFILFGIGILGLIFIPTASKAQVSLQINIGSQPQWGPTGYNHVEYYYLPDIESYYYVPRRQFVYLSNGRWVFSNNLPSRYSGYNLYNGYKVVINQPRPYAHFNDHKSKYTKYNGYHGKQNMIRNSKDSKYNPAKGQARSVQQKQGNEGRGPVNGKGHSKEKGKH
jgi:hypothetical protein